MTGKVKVLFSLLRAGLYGIPVTLEKVPTSKEWEELLDFVTIQGVVAVAGEGLEILPQEQRPPQKLLLQWIGQTMMQKGLYTQQRQLVEELQRLWNDAGIGCAELKGNAIGKYYNTPETRYSCDFDCFLTDFERGNQVIEQHGVEVNRDFYKNSFFYWKDLYVENHHFCTPIRGNKAMKRLERELRQLLDENTAESDALFMALFLMEHAWAHFFENALTLKHLCDWAVLRKKRGDLVDWRIFGQYAHDVGFESFAESMSQLANLLDGIITLNDLKPKDRKLLDDMLAENRDVSMNKGWKTRFQLFRNFFAQNWKYKQFSNHSAMYSMLRTVNGFVFDRKPRL